MKYIIILLLVTVLGGFIGYHFPHEPIYISQCIKQECKCSPCVCQDYNVINETINMIEERDALNTDINNIGALINTDGWRSLR